MRCFVKIKFSRNAEITLSFTDVNMSFNAIRENKILAKISGFTVYCTLMVHVSVHCCFLFRQSVKKFGSKSGPVLF